MDHDKLFKELLRTFFYEFIELFVPQIARHVDRKSIAFLDKEVFTDIASGQRHEVDLLVKVKYRGRAAFFLIHVENQAKHERNFPRRMFHYFSRLDEKHALPVFPIAIFSYDRPRRRASNRYQVQFPRHRVVDFRFHAIQLNRLNWREFLNSNNPAASALMTKMKIAPKDRPRAKLEILRMIVRMRLDKARSTLIGTFMENYLRLTAEEQVVYNRDMATVAPKERKKMVVLTTPWHEEGRAEGIQTGVLKGRQDTAIELLSHRFGPGAKRFNRRVKQLDESALSKFLKAILDFEKPADVEAWLAKHKSTGAAE